MNTTFNWGDDVIDSRDIISRQEDLHGEYDALLERLEEAKSDLRFNSNSDESSLAEYEEAENNVGIAQDAIDDFNQSFDKDELDTLNAVIAQGESCGDWHHGEGLILESYFTDYIKDLIEDCYELPKEFESGKWPWCHMNMDWESAAEEAKADYDEITADGHTYFIRS